jgi:hypothetical protein
MLPLLVFQRSNSTNSFHHTLRRRLPTPDAPTLIRNRLGASDLLELHIRVVAVLEEVKAPVAPSLQLLGERIALRARGDAAVLLAPAVGWRAELVSAGVEQPDAAAGHGEVEVVLAEVAARVGRLHDVHFAFGWTGGECESMYVSVWLGLMVFMDCSLVAGTAPVRLSSSRKLDCRESI